MPAPHWLWSMAIIFVAPVAAAELGTGFATGFREEEEQQNDHNRHEHGDQLLLSRCGFIRVSFPPSGFPAGLGRCAESTRDRPRAMSSPSVLSPPLLFSDAPAANVGSLVEGRSVGWRVPVGVRHVGDALLAIVVPKVVSEALLVVVVPEIVSLENLAEGIAVLSAGNVLCGGWRRGDREHDQANHSSRRNVHGRLLCYCLRKEIRHLSARISTGHTSEFNRPIPL